MDLPKADDLRAIFEAARASGVTRLKIHPDGAIDVELAAEQAGERVVAAINAASPLDPLDVIRATAGRQVPPNGREQPDILDVIASGGRLVEIGNPDPTAPQ